MTKDHEKYLHKLSLEEQTEIFSGVRESWVQNHIPIEN